MDLRPALALRARVAYVKQLRAGESAGYKASHICALEAPEWRERRRRGQNPAKAADPISEPSA